MLYLQTQPLGGRASTHEWGGEDGHNSGTKTFIQALMISQASDFGSALPMLSSSVSLSKTTESGTLLALMTHCGLGSRWEEDHSPPFFCFLPCGGCPLVKHSWLLCNTFPLSREEEIIFQMLILRINQECLSKHLFLSL